MAAHPQQMVCVLTLILILYINYHFPLHFQPFRHDEGSRCIKSLPTSLHHPTRHVKPACLGMFYMSGCLLLHPSLTNVRWRGIIPHDGEGFPLPVVSIWVYLSLLGFIGCDEGLSIASPLLESKTEVNHQPHPLTFWVRGGFCHPPPLRALPLMFWVRGHSRLKHELEGPPTCPPSHILSELEGFSAPTYPLSHISSEGGLCSDPPSPPSPEMQVGGFVLPLPALCLVFWATEGFAHAYTPSLAWNTSQGLGLIL